MSPSGELISGCDTLADVSCPGGSQEDIVVTGSLLTVWRKMQSHGQIAAMLFLPALAVAYLPLCLQGGGALYGSWLALFGIHSALFL